jgi:hypothetical protein
MARCRLLLGRARRVSEEDCIPLPAHAVSAGRVIPAPAPPIPRPSTAQARSRGCRAPVRSPAFVLRHPPSACPVQRSRPRRPARGPPARQPGAEDPSPGASPATQGARRPVCSGLVGQRLGGRHGGAGWRGARTLRAELPTHRLPRIAGQRIQPLRRGGQCRVHCAEDAGWARQSHHRQQGYAARQA